MKVLGLVTEHNPFHNGHSYHVAASKELNKSSHVISVMSGNFLQRGAPGLMDKWTRSKIAVDNGVDLVVEIPTVFAMNSAEYFAYGSMALLDSLNIVDQVCFGSEYGEIAAFIPISQTLLDEPESYQLTLKSNLKAGLSFAKSRELALEAYITSQNKPFCNLLNSANNILGTEYIKSLLRLKSPIQPTTIKRISNDYNSRDIENPISSATAIRESLKLNDNALDLIKHTVPKPTYTGMASYLASGKNFVVIEAFSDIIIARLRMSTAESLREIHDISEGLEHRLISESLKTDSIVELINKVSTKRYTRTRIQRVLFNLLLNITKTYMGSTGHIRPLYCRVLAFNERGAELLKVMKKSSNIEIISNLAKKNHYSQEVKDMLAFDIKASNLYALGYDKSEYRSGQEEFTKRPYIENNISQNNNAL